MIPINAGTRALASPRDKSAWKITGNGEECPFMAKLKKELQNKWEKII